MQNELQAGNTTNAGREAILGDLFYAGTLGYFAMYRAMSALQAQQAQMRHDLMPSVGTYGLGATVTRFFGVPRTMSASGIIMDIGNLATLSTDLAGSKNARLNFVMSAGMLSSALEHVVPEQMFSTPTAPVSAISAVKALQMAAQQGIPVHHIDATNAATVVPLLSGIDPVALDEIQAALAVGKEITVSQANITANGWTGVGYIITDPVTGSGAYKISTGKNGGILKTVLMHAMFTIGCLAAFAKNHPVIAKAVSGSIGLIISMVRNAFMLFERCPLPIALSAMVSLLAWNFMIIGITMALAASGVGSFAVFLLLSLVEGKMENMFTDSLSSKCN